MTSLTKSEILAMFVAKQDPREWLKKPIRKDEWLYATDGVVMVRVQDDPKIKASSPKELSGTNFNIARPFERIPNDAVYSPVSIDPQYQPCPDCKGKKQVKVYDKIKCTVCDGDGEFFHGNHYYHCKECDGEGQVDAETYQLEDCDTCGSTGQKLLDPVIGNNSFQGKYIDMLMKLPGLAMWSEERNSYCAFRFDGGDGIIMPLRT